ncbi:uncharacterized protein TNCV_339231 [Trichonephila clavipes]|nr:uncharacterized protein TNCV_339231 [Trichonephila clavipes]
MANYSKRPLFLKPRKGTNNKTNYSNVVNSLVRSNISYARVTHDGQTQAPTNSTAPQQRTSRSDDSSTFNLGDTNTEIHKVAVKPPAFWQNKPKSWFLQLEAEFSNSGISNNTTKYNIVVAALNENVLDFLVDILSNIPHDNKYETLKNALLNRLTDTEELLTDMELGDRRPSDLLRQMKSLAGSSISDELIKSLWLQRLPQQTQAILSISKDSLNNIAEMADKIIAVYSSSEKCSVTNNNSSTKSNDRNKLEALQTDIAALTKKFDEFSQNS